MNTSIILFLFPLFFLIHELEEFLMMRSWIEKNSIAMYGRFPRFERIIQVMQKVTRRKVAMIAFEEFLVVVVCTIVSAYTGNLIAWYCCLAAFSVYLLIHIVQFMVWRGYIPAIVTTLLCLPYCIGVICEVSLPFTSGEWVIYTLLGLILGGLNLFVMHKFVS